MQQQTIKEIKETLIHRFNSVDIKLKDIAEEMLDLTPKTANERAAKRELPFPTHRLRARSPWLVTADDLAEAIFASRRVARQEWQSVQSTSTSHRCS